MDRVTDMLTRPGTRTGSASRVWRLGTRPRHGVAPARSRLAVGLALAAVILFCAGPARANNLRITNVLWQATTLPGQTHVRFDLSWENSWRAAWTQEAATTAIGQDLLVENWDAAWVFVKFRATNSTDGYLHATLSTNATDHMIPAGITNTVGLSNDGGKGLGVFVYRAAGGNGPSDLTCVKLRWLHETDGATNDAYDIQVHAIEMVYVPEGPFALGSALGALGNEADCFYKADDTNQPYIVTNGAAIAVSSNAVAGNLWAKGRVEDSSVVSNAFPSGFTAFYCMKYEVTQGQYADFLNGLSSNNATARFPNQDGVSRHTISVTGGVYSASRPNRACNYLAWSNGAAYAAWTGLRPMSELEIVKACRGPLDAVADEYPCGTPSAWSIPGDPAGVQLSIAPGTPEDGTETVTNYPSGNGAALCHLGGGGHGNIHGGDEGAGPLRAGIFATNNCSRVDAGSTYWGILDVLGSVFERQVTIANATGRKFRGTHGSGTPVLPSDWPQDNATGSGVSGTAWGNNAEYGKTAERGAVTWDPWVSYARWCGMRGGRTAPTSTLFTGGPTNSYGNARFSGGSYDGFALGTSNAAPMRTATPKGTLYVWLDQFGLIDYENDDLLDPDGDGLFTWEEYITGTDPKNAASLFVVLDVYAAPGSNRVTFYGTTNGVTLPFRIYRSTNLVTGLSWQFYSTKSRDPSGTNVWWDIAPPPTGTPVFYRPAATNVVE
ncbi:SUMF1/EgtB/PvdO family nonheme iron enzyme [Verrucomicrobiota bacterium]